MGRYVPSKTEQNPREHKLLYSSELDSPPYITTRQGEYSDSDHAHCKTNSLFKENRRQIVVAQNM